MKRFTAWLSVAFAATTLSSAALATEDEDFFKGKQPEMPVLLVGARPVEEWVEAVPGQPLTFRTKGVGRPHDLTLVALYKLPPQRYSLYWDILTTEQWKAQQ